MVCLERIELLLQGAFCEHETLEARTLASTRCQASVAVRRFTFCIPRCLVLIGQSNRKASSALSFTSYHIFLPRPPNPSCPTFRPASSFANSSLLCNPQSACSLTAKSIPAVKVSPAPHVQYSRAQSFAFALRALRAALACFALSLPLYSFLASLVFSRTSGFSLYSFLAFLNCSCCSSRYSF